MRKLLALAFLALSVASANAQYLNVSPSGGGGTPGGSDLQLQYNNAGAFGGMSGTSWDNTNRSLTITGVSSTTTPTLSIISASTASFNQMMNFEASLAANGSTTFWSMGKSASIYNRFSFAYNHTADNSANNYFSIVAFSGGVPFVMTGDGRFGLGTTTPSERVTLNAAGNIGWGAATADLIVGRKTAASFRHGAADTDLNAGIVAQTVTFQGALAGGTADQAGKVATIDGSPGKGTGVGGNINMRVNLAGASGTAINPYVDALTIDASAAVPRVIAGGPVKLKGYTVATLPTGSEGDEAYVTDQLTACPALGGTFTGGGAVKCSAFFDGTAWVHE